jgi:hypothetical protein
MKVFNLKSLLLAWPELLLDIPKGAYYVCASFR